MRDEEAVRDMYKRYVYSYAKASLFADDDEAKLIYYGAAIACGRTLGKDMRRIKKDFKIAEDYYRRVGN